MNIPISGAIRNKKEEYGDLPQAAGIYIYKKAGEIVYIGKSVNIRARIKGHAEAAKINAKELAIIENADTIEYAVTASDFDAIILEAHLIKQYKPRYNVQWRDDKNFAYIRIPLQDDYPKITVTRSGGRDEALYIGPFQSKKVASILLRLIRKIVPYCTSNRIQKSPCFYSKIGLCNPCPNTIEQLPNEPKKRTLRAQYRRNIKKIVRILEGKLSDITADIHKQLEAASRREDFEEAIQLRNKLKYIDYLLGERFISFGTELDTLYLLDPQKDMNELTSILQHHIEINAVSRIECFDISQTGEQDIVASMVVMTDGRIDKSNYKRFKIKSETAMSDFDRIQEVLERRLRHTEDWGLPDLLVVDGGKPQVRVGKRVLAAMGLSIPLIGIAKHPDRLVMGNEQLETVYITIHNRGFNLIRALRDEAHRFANSYRNVLQKKRLL